MSVLKKLFCSPDSNLPIGICLGGGGALGFAHIGVLQSLEDHGIYPQYISGSSMGAIIGTLYAAGFSPADMLQLIIDDKLYKVTKLMSFSPSLFKSGVSNHNTLRTLIKELIPHNSFEQLQKKLYVCISNLNSAEYEIKHSGTDLDKWVAASASIPGVFEAIKDEEVYYVDGGLLNNMPAQCLVRNCKTIIGVDVIPHVAPSELNRPTDTLAYSLRAVQHQNSMGGRSLCHYVIEPKAVQEFHEFKYDAYQAIYQYGYSAATKYFVENPEILKLATAEALKKIPL
jgi:NTE family protein